MPRAPLPEFKRAIYLQYCKFDAIPLARDRLKQTNGQEAGCGEFQGLSSRKFRSIASLVGTGSDVVASCLLVHERSRGL